LALYGQQGKIAFPETSFRAKIPQIKRILAVVILSLISKLSIAHIHRVFSNSLLANVLFKFLKVFFHQLTYQILLSHE